MFSFVKARAKEVSSLHGGALIAIGCIVLFAGNIATIAAWASIAWGLVAVLKKD